SPSQRREAGGPSSPPADQVRAIDQWDHGEGNRAENPGVIPAARRRGDRMIGRREFITLLGGAAAWPLAARAQQQGKVPTIGFLGAASAAVWRPWTDAFVQRLDELGWIQGRTVAIEYRWAEGRPERYAEIADEFVRRNVDVIVTAETAVAAAKQATSTIPIIFAIGTDPIAAGLVASLSKPGGNVTGLSNMQIDLTGKRLE